MIVYGIKNCDTVKKALQWLKKNNIEFIFHDYKTQGIAESKLKDWSTQVSWESLLNKKGTTWRQLDDAVKEKIISASTAIPLMKEKTSIIKRPLIEKKGKVVILGFDESEYQKKFKK